MWIFFLDRTRELRLNFRRLNMKITSYDLTRKRGERDVYKVSFFGRSRLDETARRLDVTIDVGHLSTRPRVNDVLRLLEVRVGHLSRTIYLKLNRWFKKSWKIKSSTFLLYVPYFHVFQLFISHRSRLVCVCIPGNVCRISWNFLFPRPSLSEFPAPHAIY